VLEAAKSANREQHRGAMKEWLAAEQRRRAVCLAMATPLPASDEKNQSAAPLSIGERVGRS